MTKMEQIERQIRGLTRAELAALRVWFQKYDADAWDRQIEADVHAGKLDKLAETALQQHKAGHSKQL